MLDETTVEVVFRTPDGYGSASGAFSHDEKWPKPQCMGE
jgi:hypothetical protein